MDINFSKELPSEQLKQVQIKLRKKIGRELYNNNNEFQENAESILGANIKLVPAKLMHKIFRSSTTRERLTQLQTSIQEKRKYYSETISSIPRYQLSEYIMEDTSGLTEEDAEIGVSAIKILFKSPDKIENFPSIIEDPFGDTLYRVKTGISRLEREGIPAPEENMTEHLDEMNQKYQALLEQYRYLEYIRTYCIPEEKSTLTGSRNLSERLESISDEMLRLENELYEIEAKVESVLKANNINDGFDNRFKIFVKKMIQKLKGLFKPKSKPLLTETSESIGNSHTDREKFVESMQPQQPQQQQPLEYQQSSEQPQKPKQPEQKGEEGEKYPGSDN